MAATEGGKSAKASNGAAGGIGKATGEELTWKNRTKNIALLTGITGQVM